MTNTELIETPDSKLGTVGLALKQALLEAQEREANPTTTKDGGKKKKTVRAKPASRDVSEANGIVKGQIVPAKIVALLPYGALCKLDNGPTGLLHVNELNGGTYHNRKKRLESLKKGEELAVEVIAITLPDPEKKKGRTTFSVSEKSIQDRAVKEALVRGTSYTEGTTVKGTVKEVRKDFALVTITDGPAEGYIALLHALEVPGRGRKERDAFVQGLTVGQEIASEVISVDTPEKGDLRIGVSLVAVDRRNLESAVSTVVNAADRGEHVKVAGVIKKVKEFGAIVEMTDGPLAGRRGLLHVTQVPGRGRTERDAFVAELKAGETIESVIISAENDDELRVGLSLIAASQE